MWWGQPPPPRWLSFGRRNFTGFHQLFEPAEVFTNGLIRLLAEHLCDGGAELAARRVVLQMHGDARSVRILAEVHRASGGDRRPCERLPADDFVVNLVDDPRVPFDPHPRGTFGDPVRNTFLAYRYRLEVLHELGKVLEVAPEPVELGQRPADRG